MYFNFTKCHRKTVRKESLRKLLHYQSLQSAILWSNDTKLQKLKRLLPTTKSIFSSPNLYLKTSRCQSNLPESNNNCTAQILQNTLRENSIFTSKYVEYNGSAVFQMFDVLKEQTFFQKNTAISSYWPSHWFFNKFH